MILQSFRQEKPHTFVHRTALEGARDTSGFLSLPAMCSNLLCNQVLSQMDNFITFPNTFGKHARAHRKALFASKVAFFFSALSLQADGHGSLPLDFSNRNLQVSSSIFPQTPENTLEALQVNSFKPLRFKKQYSRNSYVI